MDKFYETHREYVYRIEIQDGNKKIYGTAFAISEVTMLTSARLFWEIESPKISARKSWSDGFVVELEVVYSKPSMNLTLLKVKGKKLKGRNGMLAEDGALKIGENVYGITNILTCDAFFLQGKVGDPCSESQSVSQLADSSSSCRKYEFNALFEQDQSPCIKMGNIFNKFTSIFDSKFERSLNPHLPLITCLDFVCYLDGDGGPVLNQEGNVVGMIIMGGEEFVVALHVSVLRAFIQRSNDKKNNPRKKKRKV